MAGRGTADAPAASERLLGIAEAFDLVPDLLEDRYDRVADQRLVIDDPDTGHGVLLFVWSRKDLLESVFDEEFGFRLVNFSIKPVHVANGLARSLSGRTYDTTAVTRLVRRYVRNQKLGVDVERYPNAEVIADYGAAFATSKGHEPDALKVRDQSPR